MPVRRVPGPAAGRIEQLAKEVAKYEARAGWMESAKYEDGTPVAYVAAIQEHGAGHIPPRPFLRPTVAAQMPHWKAKTRALLRNATSGVAVLDGVGTVMAGDIREAIAAITDPPLAPATLRARKKKGNSSKKPLVDTRVLINTLTSDTVSRGT